MTRNHNGECGLECDECGAEFWGGILDFREMIQAAKNAGWLIHKSGEAWEHECPDCWAQSK